MTSQGRGSLLRIAAAAVLIALALAMPVPAGAHTDRVASAAAWIAAELEANGNTLPSSFDPSFTDWGLTIDAILALAASSRGTGQAATLATDEVEANVGSYVSGQDFGAPDDRFAGAIGKALLVATVQGRDASAFGPPGDEWDLDAESRSLLQTSGSQAGRFSDVSSSDFDNPPDGVPDDFSNGFGQALNTMGLAWTAGGVPASAVPFLLDQQCPGGGFRLVYQDTNAATNDTAGCDADASADPDATAFAVQALLTATTSGAVRQAIVKATAWLEVVQQDDGGFSGVGTGNANANTTGLAGAALLAVKHATSSAAAHAWVEARQLTSANAASAADDIGAIARDDAMLATAQSGGISDNDRDTWRRATTQGLLALGLPAYNQIGLTVAAPTAEASPASATPGDQITITGARFAFLEGMIVTVDDATAAIAEGSTNDNGDVSIIFVLPNLTAGTHSLVLRGATSELTAGDALTVVVQQTATTDPPAVLGSGTDDDDDSDSPSGELAATGRDLRVPATVGLIVLVYGLLFISLARLRCAGSLSQ